MKKTETLAFMTRKLTAHGRHLQLEFKSLQESFRNSEGTEAQYEYLCRLVDWARTNREEYAKMQADLVLVQALTYGILD